MTDYSIGMREGLTNVGFWEQNVINELKVIASQDIILLQAEYPQEKVCNLYLHITYLNKVTYE